MADRLSTANIQQVLDSASVAFSDVALKLRIRRLLVSPGSGAAPNDSNYLGTNVPFPYANSSLIVKYIGPEPARAAQYYQSRITANRPEVSVVPITQHDNVTQTVDKMAGLQERFTGELLDSAGLREFQRQAGWAMSVGGAAFGVVMPRDADWGLPQRLYYEDLTDAEVERLKHEGKISPLPRVSKSGAVRYAERGDLWQARRKAAMADRAVSGNSLFTMRAWPRDQVLFENDRDSVRLGPKWAALIEEVPAYGVMEGSELARSAARMRGVDKEGEYGLWVKDGKVIGGVSLGVPPNGSNLRRPEWFTLIRYYDRTEQVILVSPMGGTRGAFEVYRGPHRCTVMGAPANPVVEIPFFRTDTASVNQAYSTPLDGVMALAPVINQMMTLLSNASAWNLIPRLINILKEGTPVRGVDGQPERSNSGQVPGLDPSKIAAYSGDVKQMLIETKNSNDLLSMLFELMAQAMPSPAATGASGETTAWGTQIAVEQQQAILKEPVDNFTAAIRGICWRMYGWLRLLDIPVQFHSAPGSRQNPRTARALTEFNPRDLTDSIVVEQDVDTPEEATVRKQVGFSLWQGGAIDDEEFAGTYLKQQDPRQWQVNRYAQVIENYVAYGAIPPNVDPALFQQSMLVQIANSVRGEVHYELLEVSPNYAWAAAEAMAQDAAMQQQSAMQPQQQQGLGGEISQAGGQSRPGLGMDASLQGQLGGNAPGAAGIAAEMMPL